MDQLIQMIVNVGVTKKTQPVRRIFSVESCLYEFTPATWQNSAQENYSNGFIILSTLVLNMFTCTMLMFMRMNHKRTLSNSS